MFCYDKVKSEYGLAGIAYQFASAKYSTALLRFAEIKEIGLFGKGLGLREVNFSIFSSLDRPTQRNWINSIITLPISKLENEAI